MCQCFRTLRNVQQSWTYWLAKTSCLKVTTESFKVLRAGLRKKVRWRTKPRLHSRLAVTRQGVLQRLAWHLTVMSLILPDNRSVRPVLMASCLVIQQHPLGRAGDPVTHTQTQSFNTKLQTSSVSLRCLPAAGEAAGYELSFTGTNGKKKVSKCTPNKLFHTVSPSQISTAFVVYLTQILGNY